MAFEQKNKRSVGEDRFGKKRFMSDTTMTSSVELKGRDTVLVSGCRGIIDFGAERICFRTDDGVFKVEGQNLNMCGFENECIEIRGTVYAVTVCGSNDIHQSGGR